MGWEHAEAFFAEAKPRLERLQLWFDGDERRCQDIGWTIAKNSGGLRDIDLCGPRLSREGFEQFVLANKFLETVIVGLSCRYMIDLIECSLNCLLMKKISLRMRCKCIDEEAGIR